MLIGKRDEGAVPIPMAAGSKVWVCGPSLAGIAGSNPVGTWMSLFLSAVCCPVQISASD